MTNDMTINSKDDLKIYKDEVIPVWKKTDTGQKVVDGRELHDFLGVARDFSTWIKQRIDDYNFEEGLDFSTYSGKSNGGRPKKEYILTLDMGKELGMIERNEQGRKIRKYFIEIEKEFKKMSEKEMARRVGIEVRKSMTDAIKESGENERMHGFAYSTYTNMIYKLVLGMSAKKYKKMNDIDGNLRDKLNGRQLNLIKTLEDIAKAQIDLGFKYDEVKEMIKINYNRYEQKLLSD